MNTLTAYVLSAAFEQDVRYDLIYNYRKLSMLVLSATDSVTVLVGYSTFGRLT